MIKNCNLWNTWALACYAVDKYGVLVPSGPNYTSNPDYIPTNIKEVTMTIEHGPASINQMLNKQLPPLYPQKQGVDSYINQMTAGTDEFEHGRTFHYTYGLRLREMPCGCEYIDQLDFIAEHLDAFNKRLQAITWIPNVDLESTIVDEMVKSVTCLQRIRIENYYDKYYVLFVDWRSRDLYKAHPYNLVGLINAIDKLIQEKRAEQGKSKLELFKIVEFIDSLHVYAPELDMLNKVPVDAKTIMNCLYI